MRVVKVLAPKEEGKKREIEREPFILKVVKILSSVGGFLFPKLLAPSYVTLFSKPRFRARHKVKDSLLSSLTESEILVDELKIAIYEWSIKEDAPWVVLVHGWESRGTALRSFVPYLHELGYNVSTFDGLGHGNSGGTTNTMIQQANVLDFVISLYQKVDGVVAHSFGSAATCFLYANKRKKESLDFVVLISSPNKIMRIFKAFFNIVLAPKPLQKAILKHIQDKFDVEVKDINVDGMLNRTVFEKGIIVHDELDEVALFDNAVALHQVKPNFTMIKTKNLGHFNIVKNTQVLEAVQKEIQSKLL